MTDAVRLRGGVPPIDAIRARLDESTARGLARAVGRAVSEGAVEPGTRLPPIRGLADELLLSPTTVSAAWALLARSGTIRTDGRRGTVVAVRPATAPSRYRRALDRSSPFELDLSTGVPDAALLPDLGAALRRLHAVSAPETYLDAPVVAELAEHLQGIWPAPADLITVTDGAMDALDLIASTFLHFGERVAVETPCFPPLLDLLEAVGVEVIGVELDDDGPLPASLRRAVDAGVRAAFVQPRAQNPTGAAITAARAAELTAVLDRSDVLVVENDSAGAVASEPLCSLGVARPAHTLHVRSFSKSHGPDLRLAAVGGPRPLVERLAERRHLGQGWTSRLLQRVLLDLLTHRTSVAQVERAREHYARRRRLLVGALAEQGVAVGGRDGINVWVPVADENAALIGLAARGIGVTAGTPFLVGGNGPPHIRVTSGLLGARHRDVAAHLADAAGRPARTAPR